MFARLTILVLLLASQAWAGPTIDVQTGFGGRTRPERWNPIFLTLSNDQPLSAAVTISVGDSVVLHRMVGIGPQAATYTAYAPLSDGFPQIKVDVVDIATSKSILKWPTDNTPPAGFNTEGPVDFFVLTAGRAPAMRGFSRSVDNVVTTVQSVRQSFLPTTPAGYDAVDLLALNDPDWANLAADQQRAMLSWIDAGGVMLLWPGIDAVPANAPLAEALPADLGATQPLQLSADVRKSAGLPGRFATISERPLTPHDHTAMLPVIGDVFAPVVRRGLGRIVVMPIDASAFQFKSDDQRQAFWNNLIDPLFGRPAQDSDTGQMLHSAPITYAAQAALDRIGTLPNVGVFSFSYVMLVIGGMILLVGPLDYFLLKKLRRQPFTWATTALWIALFTTGALYAGHFVQSGELYFRTLQVIDQADDRIVGHDTVALVYAPRSERYALQPTGVSWWQPTQASNRIGSSAFSSTIDLIQDDRGTSPLPIWIDVWNWQFLLGRSDEPAGPMVEASLSVSGRQITGTVRNLTTSTLTDVQIEADGVRAAVNQTIEPGRTISINEALTESPKNPNYPYTANIFDLAGTRSDAFRRPTLAGFTKTATVYAALSKVSPDIRLDHPDVREEHVGLLRATVELIP